MKTAIRTAAIAALFLPACALAQQNLSFSTSLDLNYKRMEVEIASAGAFGTTSTTYQPTLWTLNLTPSIAWHGIFLSLGLERSLSEGSTSDYISGGAIWSDRRFSREENNLTLGYSVWAGLSLFAGYLDNSTKMTFTNYPVGGVGTISAGKVTYDEKGPYYGLGYSHRFAGGGSVSASYAYLKGRGSYRSDSPSSATIPLQTYDGDVRGSGFGLTWSAPLVGSLYYRIGYKGNRYTFDFADQFGNARTTKQSYDAFFLGVANYF